MASDLTVSADLLTEFRRTVREVRQLYRHAAQLYVQTHRLADDETAESVAAGYEDLHRGLLVKVYCVICEADRAWTQPERLLAELLFEHLWNQSLTGDALREATIHASQQSATLAWHALVRPFDSRGAAADLVGQLKTLTLRAANLIAKADGEVTPNEYNALVGLRNELERHLQPLPFDRDEPTGNGAVIRPPSSIAAAQAGDRKGIDRKDKNQVKKSDSSQSAAATPAPVQKEQLAASWAELVQLVGLATVKREVQTLLNYLKMQQERVRLGLPHTSMSLHTVFTGNPGTGKTTVARIFGKLLGAMGILRSGHLIETDRSGLVAEYAGQTGPKTNRRIDEALDGVLFIDEAYSLCSSDGPDAYGDEAIQTLLKRMEDDRSRLVVILAGYPAPIKAMLQTNPGLQSRFNRFLHFDDYSPVELARIIESLCTACHYELPAQARSRLLWGLSYLHARRDEHFGNGRLARNIFENAVCRLADRIAGIAPLTKELLTVMHADDVVVDEAPSEIWQRADDPNGRFELTCPTCNARRILKQPQLGDNVRCSCGARFTAAWGSPVDQGV